METGQGGSECGFFVGEGLYSMLSCGWKRGMGMRRAGHIAIALSLAVALTPSLVRAGRLVADPDASSPNQISFANRNSTLELPRLYAPDGSPPDDVAEAGTADSEHFDPNSNGPLPGSVAAEEIPDLPDSGGLAINAEPDSTATTSYATNPDPDGSDNQGATPNSDVGSAEDYQNQVNEGPPVVVMVPGPYYPPPAVVGPLPYGAGPTPYYGNPAMGAYTYNRYYPPTSAYIPPGAPAFTGGMGAAPSWNIPPALRPVGPIGPPAWSVTPMIPGGATVPRMGSFLGR
jgi:hypothetical protein